MVHFPIVLFLLSVLIDLLVLIRKGDLATSSCLPTSGFYVLLLAALFAVAAAAFGDIAFDKALELGFDKAPLEKHEELGFTTLWILLGLTGWQLLARWRGMSLSASKGWLFFVAALVGIGILLTTAYYGGELVYGIGVNVTPVHP